MKNEGEVLKEASKEVKIFVKWGVSSLLDGVFIGFWLLIQWVVQRLIESFPPAGIDLWLLRVFQVLFAITTLAPIIGFIYVDIMIMIYRARKHVQDERDRLG